MKINVLVVVCLMVVMSAAMVAPVMAIDTGTSTITGNPGAVIDIVVTGSITGWALTAGTTNTKADTVTLGVSSNYIGWVVAVKDASDGSKPLSWAGRMVEWDGSAYVASPKVLGANMTVTGATVTGSSGSSAILGSVDQIIETGTAIVTSLEIPLTFAQAVAYTDPHLTTLNHVYRIVITFTGAAS